MREEVDAGALEARVEDADLGVGDAAAEAGLGVGLVLDLPVAAGRACCCLVGGVGGGSEERREKKKERERGVRSREEEVEKKTLDRRRLRRRRLFFVIRGIVFGHANARQTPNSHRRAPEIEKGAPRPLFEQGRRSAHGQESEIDRRGSWPESRAAHRRRPHRAGFSIAPLAARSSLFLAFSVALSPQQVAEATELDRIQGSRKEEKSCADERATWATMLISQRSGGGRSSKEGAATQRVSPLALTLARALCLALQESHRRTSRRRSLAEKKTKQTKRTSRHCWQSFFLFFSGGRSLLSIGK